MPRMRRRRYASRRVYRRRWRYYRRAGKRRAAAGNRQRNRVVIKSTFVGDIIVASTGYIQGQSETIPNLAGTASISAYANLIRSNYMKQLVNMYDQFRIDSFKVKLVPTRSVLLANENQAIFVSAWDRNGMTSASSPPSFSEIASYSSAFQRPINMTATTWSATRKITAATLQEKQFYPTSALEVLAVAEQTSTVPWNPNLLIGVMFTTSVITGSTSFDPTPQAFTANQSWHFMAQLEWTLSLRGLRYDAPSSAPVVALHTQNNATAGLNTGTYTTQVTKMEEIEPTNGTTHNPTLQIYDSYPYFPPGLFKTLAVYDIQNGAEDWHFDHGQSAGAIVFSYEETQGFWPFQAGFNTSTSREGYLFCYFVAMFQIRMNPSNPQNVNESYLDCGFYFAGPETYNTRIHIDDIFPVTVSGYTKFSFAVLSMGRLGPSFYTTETPSTAYRWTCTMQTADGRPTLLNNQPGPSEATGNTYQDVFVGYSYDTIQITVNYYQLTYQYTIDLQTIGDQGEG